MTTNTVVALYQDAEIGLGEGDSYEWALQECIESIAPIYPADEVILECRNSEWPVIVTMPLSVALTAS